MGLLILIAALLATDAPQFQVDTIDGQSVVGSLAILQGQQVVVKTADADRTFKLSEVRSIFTSASKPASGFPGGSSSNGPPSSVTLETIDGARLSGIGFEVTKGLAKLKQTATESIGIPTKFIHRVDFTLNGKPAVWPELPKDAAGDLIVVQKKEATDLVEGVIGDVSAETVQFSIESEVVPVKRTKVVGLVYFHSPQTDSTSNTMAIVENMSGGKVNAKEVALVEGKLAITTTFGAVLNWPLGSVRTLDFSPSRMVYLSDLPVDSSEWTPFLKFGKQIDALSQFYKPRFDRSLDGGNLRIGGQTYRKGVAMAARTILEYKIAGRGRQFRAMAGIDDSVHGGGNVVLTIEGDGKTLYTGKITGRDKAADLNFDVSGVKRLRIVADFGGGADVGDYLDLGDARIVK